MPVDADAQYALFPSDEAPVPVECKMLDLEKKLTQDVSRTASSFDFTGSRWNRRVGKHRSVFQVRETSVYTGGNEETFDYDMYLMEADSESRSARDSQDVCYLSAPGLKCSMIKQSEALPPAPATEESAEEPEEKKDEVAQEEKEPVAEGEAAEGEGGGGENKEEGEGEGKAAEDDKPTEPSAPAEVFDDSRKEGTSTNVFLANALKLRSSEEATERVERSPPQLVKTIESSHSDPAFLFFIRGRTAANAGIMRIAEVRLNLKEGARKTRCSPCASPSRVCHVHGHVVFYF